MSEPLSSNAKVSIHEAAAIGKKLRADHASSGAAWSFEDWLTIRYEELRRRFERACARVTQLESTADEPSEHPVAWVIPGDDTANVNGFIDARVTQEGEFSKPLYARPSVPPSVEPAVAQDLREFLGKLVRMEWMNWAREQPNPKQSWLIPWDELSEPDREVDRRIGERIYKFAQCRHDSASVPPNGHPTDICV